jgi:signal transduction histidine kinase
MPEKGKLEISTCIVKDELFVEIADSGEGISLKDNERVFEPGFTTKGVKVGVGLGLPICYQIVKSHQGDIEIKSEPDEGTKVIIKLPTDLRQPLI